MEAVEIYVVAVITGCSFFDEDETYRDFLYLILNKDKFAKSGIRYPVQPSDELYKFMCDKIKSQDIDLSSDFLPTCHPLPYPISIGTVTAFKSLSFLETIDDFKGISNELGHYIHSDNDCIAFTDSNKCFEVFFNPTRRKSWLELIDFLKGNYFYSSFDYQAKAVNELIELFKQFRSIQIKDYFKESILYIQKTNVQAKVEDRLGLGLSLYYPKIDYEIWIDGVYSIPRFICGIAIVEVDGGYNLIDIRGHILFKRCFSNVSPLVEYGNRNEKKLVSYIEISESDIRQLNITICKDQCDYSAYINRLKYEKVFQTGEYHLCFSKDDDSEEEYSSGSLFVYKGTNLINEILIEDIDEVSDSCYKIRRYNYGKHTLGVSKFEDSHFIEVIPYDDKFTDIQHVTGKFWLIWVKESSDYYHYFYNENKNLELENGDLLEYYDMTGYFIKDSAHAVLYHEDKGNLGYAGGIQSYMNIVDSNGDPLLLTYEGTWHEGYLDEETGDLVDGYYQEEYRGYAYYMNGDGFVFNKNDEL